MTFFYYDVLTPVYEAAHESFITAQNLAGVRK